MPLGLVLIDAHAVRRPNVHGDYGTFSHFLRVMAFEVIKQVELTFTELFLQ